MKFSDLDLDKLNSATKYPSILTYHAMADKGRLKDEVQVPLGDEVFVTEKIDGTNTRIIIFGGSYVLGSREELLYHRGDLISNPAQGIVQAVRPVANQVMVKDFLGRLQSWQPPDGALVIYGETYGGNVTAGSKHYTKDRAVTGFRVFDVAYLALDQLASMNLEWPVEKIAAWRDNGGQSFLSVAEQVDLCRVLGLDRVPEVAASGPPSGLAETFSWLKAALPGPTMAALPGATPGRPEGVVIRSADRKRIAKIRFEDYERTFR